MSFESNRWYAMRLRLTDAKVEAWVDGEKVIDLARAGRNLTLPPNRQAAAPFGLEARSSTVALCNIRLRRVPGSAPGDSKPSYADLAGLTEGKWISLLPSRDKLTGWQVPVEGVRYADGVVELGGPSPGSMCHSINAKDMVIRARVRKLKGLNLGLRLRNQKNGFYVAWYNGRGSRLFGLGMMSQEGWTGFGRIELAEDPGGFCELTFAAVGDTLILYVNGEELMRRRDTTYKSGSPGIATAPGRSQFKDIEVKVLDRDWVPPASLQEQSRPKTR
jgi:hypothetical protein